MTYTQAKMMIMNPSAYSKKDVRMAAIHILGTIGASYEDVDIATILVLTTKQKDTI